jgi:tetratricopeptide (TPR) repeat protein
LVPFVLLALLAVLLVAQPNVDGANLGHGFPGSYLRAIGKTLQSPAPASALAILLLIALAWAIRRTMLAWLAWRAGGIAVPNLEAAGAASAAKVEVLSAIFRERLALLRLESADTAPGAAPESAFLDVLDGVSSSDPVSSVMKLLRSAVPKHALTVQGVMRKREGTEPFGVTVEVAQQPSQASPIIEVWAASWEEAARNAADGVTAAILPRTRLCIGPWAGWRGYKMPPELLIAYERGALHEQEREFDQARDRYWEALRLDATNLTIRLQLGQLQEKVGNSVAALTNYLRILALACPGGGLPPRGLYRRDARRERERTLTLAQYRAIVLFGDSALVTQLCGDLPQAESVPNRTELRNEFEELLRPLSENTWVDPTSHTIASATSLLLNEVADCDPHDKSNPRDISKLRLKLIRLADEAAIELKLSLPRLEARPHTLALTRRTVSLTKICLEQRRKALEGKPGQLSGKSLKRLTWRIRIAGWNPGPWAGWWPSCFRRWQWHEHYNAACVYALAIMRSADDRLVARHAIERLEQAIATRDSGFASNWRDWVMHEDPDLKKLRPTKEFTSFEAMYFPGDGPPRSTPRAEELQHRLIEALYTVDALRARALRRSETWQRQATGRIDWRVISAWCHEDGRLWDAVEAIARDRYDWRVRQKFLREAQPLAGEPLSEAVAFISHGELEMLLGGVDEESSGADQLEVGQGLRKFLDRRMELLHQELAAGNRAWRDWRMMLARVSASRPPIPPERAVDLCESHAGVWRALAEWLAVEEHVIAHVADQGKWGRRMGDRSNQAHGTLTAEIDLAAKAWRRTLKARA